jgi:hypothetical protein
LGEGNSEVIRAGHDTYTWLPLAEPPPGQTPRDPGIRDEQCIQVRSAETLMKLPTKRKWNLSTTDSVYSRMTNPLLGLTEKAAEIPTGDIAKSCSGIGGIGDVVIFSGKIVSIFDASARYSGRFFLTGIGGCAGPNRGMAAGSGIFEVMGKATPGNACGCSPNLQVTDIMLTPMAGEENWVAYQTVRTSQAVEDLPIRQIGVNFGAPGDRCARTGPCGRITPMREFVGSTAILRMPDRKSCPWFR